MKVLKFGGSSVANAENIEKVIEIIKSEIAEDSCVVVLSAMQGATDALIEIGRAAERGDESFRGKITEIGDKHLAAIDNLLPENERASVKKLVEENISELEKICEGVYLLRELTVRTLDRIVSFGEILLTKIISAKFDSLNIENIWKDSRELIKTDSNFGFAAVDFAKTNELIKEFFGDKIQNPKSKIQNLFVLPGFVAS